MGRRQGLTEQQLRDLNVYEASVAFSELEKLVLSYAEAMTQTPVEVTDDLFAALQRHFDTKQIVELTSAIAWENYRARFDHAFGIEPEGFSEGAFCPVPARAGAATHAQSFVKPQ